jgi:hypothetical protein
MKVLLSLICLNGVLANAYASDWRLVWENEATQYFQDYDSFIKDGDLVSYWTRLNYLTGEKQGKSQGFFYIMDCKKREYKIRYTIIYSEKNFRGEKIESKYDTVNWTPIVPDTAADRTFNKYCR